MTDNKTCPTCLESFLPKRTDQIYCSSKCRQSAFRNRKDDLPRLLPIPSDLRKFRTKWGNVAVMNTANIGKHKLLVSLFQKTSDMDNLARAD